MLSQDQDDKLVTHRINRMILPLEQSLVIYLPGGCRSNEKASEAHVCKGVSVAEA